MNSIKSGTECLSLRDSLFPCSEVFVSGEGEKRKKLEVGIKNVYFFLGLRRCGLFIFYGKIFLYAMRKLLSALILSFQYGAFFMPAGNNVTVKQYPMFWTWLDYRPGMNFDSVCQVMNDIGMDGIMLNAPTPDDYRIAIPIARKHGIEVYAWLWTMNLEHDRDKILAEHPDWFSVNRNGKSLADTTAYVDYYKFLCPALPEVREFIREKIKSYCEVEGLNGIAIDYNRLVDVVLPTTLWPHYGIVQDREYAAWDYGYHPAMLEKFKSRYGYDPREQQDPSTDIKWRQFRCDQITEVANMIAGVVHSYGKTMAASPFPTPKMASRMVRQDWGKWNLDIVFRWFTILSIRKMSVLFPIVRLRMCATRMMKPYCIAA